MMALGVDLGGTKIAAQVFDDRWQPAGDLRLPTPRDYSGLLAALVDVVAWADAQGGNAGVMPVGIGAAGALRPRTGQVLAANLAADGQRLPADLAQALGRKVTYVNDSRALALSESVFGAGRPYRDVYALVLGTGVGGGFVRDGQLAAGYSGLGGEIGQIPASADLAQRYGLPVLDCPCGQRGCAETWLSGAGLARLAKHLAGLDMTAPQVIAARHADPRLAQVWQVWCALCADLLRVVMLVADPECIVLGGGMSDIDGLADDLTQALADAQYAGFDCPVILRAMGGAISGARGAAYAAWQDSAHG
jgi:N-acetylglucosamine kinase